MKRIYVCVKQVPHTETKISLKADQSGIEEAGVKWIVNPYDEYAIEEAVKIKEANNQTPVVVVISVGPKARVAESVRTALAMGADEGLVIDGADGLDAFNVAKLVAAAITKEGPGDLILTGKLAIDDNASSFSQYLAEFLQIPHATVVSQLKIEGDSLVAEREVEGGTREVLRLKGPAVVAANKGLNTPRYVSLPGIMKAKKKPLKEVAPADLGVSIKVRTRFAKFQLPPEKPAVKMISGDADQQARELARLLVEEAKVF